MPVLSDMLPSPKRPDQVLWNKLGVSDYDLLKGLEFKEPHIIYMLPNSRRRPRFYFGPIIRKKKDG